MKRLKIRLCYKIKGELKPPKIVEKEPEVQERKIKLKKTFHNLQLEEIWNNKCESKVGGGGVFHKTIITQSKRFKVLEQLKPMFKDKEYWYNKIYVGCLNSK
jgi:hypothetical protein